MENITFEVKENSIHEFFSKYIVKDENSINRRDFDGPQNPFYYFKDKIYLKLEVLKNFSIGSQVKFTLSDRGRLSDRNLINIYRYTVKAYDQISCELTLTEFDVEVK